MTQCTGSIHVFTRPGDGEVCQCGMMTLEYGIGQKTIRNAAGEKIRRFDGGYHRGALVITIIDPNEPEIIKYHVSCCHVASCPGYILTEMRHPDYSEWSLKVVEAS